MPFCFHKCHYCDFYSIVDSQDRQGAFTDRLIRELVALAPLAGAPLDTIFVGGGTPTLLAPEHWARLLKALRDHVDLGNAEFTVECNPETASDDLFAVLVDGGVNRISIGAQSFDRRHLSTLERWHDPDRVPEALDLAARHGIACRSIDLIFAIPGQTLEDFDTDLRRALDLPITHLSAYALTYEPNTAMTARLARGEFERADEDLEADMYEHLVRTVRAKGFERYEVSNFALQGEACRHNLAYWRQANWLALGPSASGHLNGWRWTNAPRLGDYLRVDDRGYAPVTVVEAPDPTRARRERLMTGLRLAEGIPSSLLDDAWIDRDAGARVLEAHRARGWIDPDHLRLTDAGMLFADGIASDLMGVVRDQPAL
ncbi:MAG: radical SAM family heme chaperone HemW [Phycisphaerales bacterium]|nr:radical SAM family heme chaperone HemW [Phycisphaerales bacterium]